MSAGSGPQASEVDRPAAGERLRVRWLGRVPYGEALRLQQETVADRRAGAAPDTLLLLEHPTVITLGRRADRGNLRAPEERLRALGIGVHEVSRGGDVTLHAPGQLVGYPIVDLAARGACDLHAFLRGIEGALIEALAGLGVRAARHPGDTGVFTAPPEAAGARPSAGAEPAPARAPRRKIASIGIGARGWVTYHGFALNVRNDLSLFDHVVPCGLRDAEMTSLARECGPAAPPDLDARARAAVAAAFRRRLA